MVGVSAAVDRGYVLGAAGALVLCREWEHTGLLCAALPCWGSAGCSLWEGPLGTAMFPILLLVTGRARLPWYQQAAGPLLPMFN